MTSAGRSPAPPTQRIDRIRAQVALNGTSADLEKGRAIATDAIAAGAISVIAGAIVAGALLGSTIPPWAIAIWFAAVVLASAFDARTLHQFSPDMDAAACRRWLGHTVHSSAWIGFAWGSLGWMLFAELSAAHTDLVAIVLMGVAGAAAVVGGAHLWTAMATIVPTMLPVLVFHATRGTLLGGAVALLVVAYAILLYQAARTRERSIEELAASHEQNRQLAESLAIIADYSHDWENWFDEDGKLLWVNPSVERVTGYTLEDCYRMESYPLDIVHPEDRERVGAGIAESQRTGDKGRLEARILRKDGIVRWTSAEWQPARDSEGNPAGVRVSVRDVTETVELRHELERQARTDPLTGLANRRRFFEIYESEMYRATRFSRSLALAIFDIDHFKRINDTHGHAVGDLCLRAFVGAIRANIRQTDIFARFGGEEFTLLMPETSLDAAEMLCDRLRREVARVTVTTGDVSVAFTVSAGITLCDPAEDTLDHALARADAALYSAKNNGRDRVRTLVGPLHDHTRSGTAGADGSSMPAEPAPGQPPRKKVAGAI